MVLKTRFSLEKSCNNAYRNVNLENKCNFVFILHNILIFFRRYMAQSERAFVDCCLNGDKLAYKELIEKTKYASKYWKQVVVQLEPFFLLPESIDDLYEYVVPTNYICVEITNEAERKFFKYLKRYLRGLDKSKRERFLKFATGIEIMHFHHSKLHSISMKKQHEDL